MDSAYPRNPFRDQRGPSLSLPGISVFLFLVTSLVLRDGGILAQEGASQPAATVAEGVWQDLFNGHDLGKWEVVSVYEYRDHGEVKVQDGCLVLEAGRPGTAIRWSGPFPRIDYELVLEAQKIAGDDFFCGLTFPVGDHLLTLIVGGWGGSVVGLSLIDGEPAAENETCRWISFERGRWYEIRLQVSQSAVNVFLDGKELIRFEPRGRRLSLRWESEPCAPLGLATWKTAAKYRTIRYRCFKPEGQSSAEK